MKVPASLRGTEIRGRKAFRDKAVWGLRGVRVKGGMYVERCWGRRGVGKTRAPMIGKNIWRLCKAYGRLIGDPELKPHDLRHGVAMEILEQHHDLEQVRALLGHARIDTTQVYASIR